MKDFKHKCELRLLVCEPNPLRPDRVTVGFVLRDTSTESPRVEVRTASNLRAIRCIYPEADVEAIQGTLLDLEPILKNVTDFENYLQNMPADCPADFQILPGIALLTDSIQSEIELLEKQYLAVPAITRAEAPQADHGRPFILRRMQEAFRQLGISQFLEREISLDDFTFKGDPLHIDFGYLNKARNSYRMFHAVSLVTELDRAKILALSWPFIREGMEKTRGQQCELLAITEDQTALATADRANAASAWMREVGVNVQPVSAVMRLAQEARNELHL